MVERTGGGGPRQVAIVMLTAVGDVVHTLPVVSSLRAAWPETRITWVIQRGPLGLVEGHPAVDEFVVFDRRRGWRGVLEVARAVRGRRFDLVLALQDYLKAGLITAMLPSERKVGRDRGRARDATWLFTPERVAGRERGHVQDEYLEFVEHLGLPVVLEWGLESTAAERDRYASLLSPRPRPVVALVVGTSKAAKEWPAERYAELCDRLDVELGADAVLVGGLSERENAAAATIRSRARRPPPDLREWDLRRLTYLLGEADAVVTPDTGPLHIAVALGTPTVAVFGHTNPKRYGPYRRFGDLLVDGYGEEGEAYDAGAGRRAGRMERIPVEPVLAKVKRALERYPRARRAAGEAR